PGRVAGAGGETRNGLVVGRRDRVAGGAAREIVDDGRGVELQIGRAQLRLRLPSAALAPAQPMTAAADTDHRWPPTLGFAVAVLLFVLASVWIDTVPEALVRSARTAVLSNIRGRVG